MYIICSKCMTNFVVSPSQIGNGGRKVKCSKCNHIWHQGSLNQFEPESGIYDENIDTDYALYAHREFYGSGANLPALLPAKASTKRPLVSFILACLIIILATLLFQNDLNYNYLSNSTGLDIKNVQIKNQEELGKIMVTYDIVNNSASKAKIPLIKIRLFDKNNRIIRTYITDQKRDTIAPGQALNIKKEFDSLTIFVKNIDITIGNQLDLILR
ncbi:MAG: zinc-ribbon domain-containing protein [Janthinobacterium lividum]